MVGRVYTQLGLLCSGELAFDGGLIFCGGILFSKGICIRQGAYFELGIVFSGDSYSVVRLVFSHELIFSGGLACIPRRAYTQWGLTFNWGLYLAGSIYAVKGYILRRDRLRWGLVFDGGIIFGGRLIYGRVLHSAGSLSSEGSFYSLEVLYLMRGGAYSW